MLDGAMMVERSEAVALSSLYRRLIKVIVVFAADLGQKGGERNEVLFAQ